MGELEVIRRIRDMVGDAGRGTVVGIGDDAAVFEPTGELELLTCDAFVEGVHFRREYASFGEIGAKCVTANISDIAAMGGHPTLAAISICVPSDVSEAEVAELYSGMLDACSRYSAEVVGGDTVSSASGLVVSIALLGTVDRGRLVTRSGAVPGDRLVVTGRLGGAEAGLLAFREGLSDEPLVADAKRRHVAPVARLAEAQALIDVATPRAMIDISDGLSTDVWHLAEESGVGVVLREEAIPVAESARAVAERLGRDPLALALRSGEEFELLVAIPAPEVTRTAEHVFAVTGTEVTLIGEVVEESSGCVMDRGEGVREPLEKTGYEHLIGL